MIQRLDPKRQAGSAVIDGDSGRMPRGITLSEAVTVAVGQGLAVLGGFILVRVLTSLLAPREFGVYALAWSAVTLAQQTVTGPLGQAISRQFRPAAETGSLAAMRAATERLVLYAIGAIVALCLVVAGVLALVSPSHVRLCIAVSAYTAVGVVSTASDSVFMAARRRRLVAAHQAAAQWIRCGFVYLFAMSWGPNAVVSIIGMTAGTLPIIASQLYFLHSSWASEPNGSNIDRHEVHFREMLAFASPFCAWGLFTWAQLVSDRWTLAVFINSAATGYYNAIYQVGFYPMLLGGGILIQLILPYLYELAGDGTDGIRTQEAIKRLLRVCLACVGATAGAFAVAQLLHARISSAALGEAYQDYSFLLPIAVLSGGLFVTAQVLSLIHSINKTTRQLLPPKVVSAVFGTSANALAAYKYGLIGVMAAGLATSVVYLAGVIYVNHGTFYSSKYRNQQDERE